MSSVVQNLLDSVIGDGARSTKFDVMINFNDPGLFPAGRDISALVKTSQFPGKTHEVIDFKFKGRTIPIKGQTKYDNTWSCTFYMTQDHLLKKAFEDWIESIDQQHNIKEICGDVRTAQLNNSNVGYSTTMRIAQADFHGDQETVIYELFHCFPKSVSAIDVDYSAVGTITEFTVEFSYVYYNTKTVKTQDGNFVDDLIDKARAGLEGAVNELKQGIGSFFAGASISAGAALTSLGDSVSELYTSAKNEINTFMSSEDDMPTKME